MTGSRQPTHTMANPAAHTDRAPTELRCSVVVFHGDDVVLVKHVQAPQEGPVWALPGGHVRAGEGLVACARRELHEETGLNAGELRCAFVLDTTDMDTGRHTAEIVFLAAGVSGVPVDHEPGLHATLIPLEGLPQLTMRPAIAGHLRGLHRSQRPASAPYLGTFAGAPTAMVVERADGTHARAGTPVADAAGRVGDDAHVET